MFDFEHALPVNRKSIRRITWYRRTWSTIQIVLVFIETILLSNSVSVSQMNLKSVADEDSILVFNVKSIFGPNDVLFSSASLIRLCLSSKLLFISHLDSCLYGIV